MRARFPLAFLPCPHPINTCGSPALLSSRRLPSVDRVCIVRLRETRTYTTTRSTLENSPCQPFCLLSPCYRPGHPPLPRQRQLLRTFSAAAAAATHEPTRCLLTHPDAETVARRGPRYRARSSFWGGRFCTGHSNYRYIFNIPELNGLAKRLPRCEPAAAIPIAVTPSAASTEPQDTVRSVHDCISNPSLRGTTLYRVFSGEDKPAGHVILEGRHDQ